jgi:sugar phosphate isomerase/epimerase
MHITYCEQGQSIDDICLKAVKWGFDGVEFRRKRAGQSETAEQYVDSIARAADASGLKIVMFGGPTVDLTLPDPEARKRQLDDAVEFYRMASRKINLTINNAFAGWLENPDSSVHYFDCKRHGSGIATEDHFQWAAEGFKVLGDLASELGFRFALEIHMCTVHDHPVSTKKLLDMIDRESVGANLDYANVLCFQDQTTLSDSISILGEKLFYVHLKNLQALTGFDWLRTALSDGEINHREYLRLLALSGFHGPIALEAPRPGDREWFAQADIAYYKRLAAECTPG